MNRLRFSFLVAGLVATCVSHAPAQVIYTNDFADPGAPTSTGPTNLLAEGWAFTTQGGDPGAEWRAGNHISDSWAPYDAPAHLTIDALPQSGVPAAAWALLPDTVEVTAGDQAFFACALWSLAETDRWELRWSPTGGATTGSQWSDVGDFTENIALNVQSCSGNHCFATASATLPGSGGRLALRYVYDTWTGGSTPAASVDALTIMRTIDPPLPAPGQVLHWTPAMGTLVLVAEKVVPPTATLVIDAGTEVVFKNSALLRVQGNLRVEGTAGDPVVFALAEGTPVGTHRVFVGFTEIFGVGPYTPATADIEHLDCGVRINTAFGASLSMAHSVFSEPFMPNARTAGIGAVQSTIVLDDVLVTNGEIELKDSYLRIDDTTFDNAPLLSFRDDASSPMHIDGVTVVNYIDDHFAGDAPLIFFGSDHFLGPNNVIANNPLPVTLYGGGLAPGSVVPTSGNGVNVVEFTGGYARGVISFARLDVPYVWRYDSSFTDLGGIVNIEPGTRIELDPDAFIAANFASQLRAIGTPTDPITFTARTPALGWRGIGFGVNGYRPKLEHCVIEHAELGVLATNTNVRLESCIVRNNVIGTNANTFGSIEAGKTRFLGNDEGVQTSAGTGSANIDGRKNPNVFAGNVLAINDLGPQNSEFAEGNWWGHPTGPLHFSNPAGEGDAVVGSVDVLPFLTAEPDFTDHPPLVRLEPLYYHATSGDKLWLHWSTEDDGSIVAQRLEYSPHSGNPPLSVMIPNIAPTARSVEITIPDAVPSSNNNPPVFRIVSVDDKGQEGWSEVLLSYQAAGNEPFAIQTDLSNGVVVGQQFAYQYTGVTGDAFILLDDMRTFVSLGYHGFDEGISLLFNDVPAASTDLARYAIYDDGWYVGDYFSIRPHVLAGDAPPQLNLTSPTDQSVLMGGQTVRMAWSASDDEGLRSFDIQASYDAGETWHSVVRQLPGDATSYDWTLPSSTGLADLRVRVIARDERFQATSDTVQVSVAPGPGVVCQPDIGFGGPGSATLSLCGDELATGAVAELRLEGAPPVSFAWLVVSATFAPQPFATGTLVPLPIQGLFPFVADPTGVVSITNVPGGMGPADVYVQFVVTDLAQPAGWGLSNALRVELLP